jgi:hypothetical protein
MGEEDLSMAYIGYKLIPNGVRSYFTRYRNA